MGSSWKQKWKAFQDRLPKPVRWVINRLDDPIDNLKHAIHGARIGPWRIDISCLMANRETRFPIFRWDPRPPAKGSITREVILVPSDSRYLVDVCDVDLREGLVLKWCRWHQAGKRTLVVDLEQMVFACTDCPARGAVEYPPK